MKMGEKNHYNLSRVFNAYILFVLVQTKEGNDITSHHHGPKYIYRIYRAILILNDNDFAVHPISFNDFPLSIINFKSSSLIFDAHHLEEAKSGATEADRRLNSEMKAMKLQPKLSSWIIRPCL